MAVTKEEMITKVREFNRFLEKECCNCSSTGVFRLESKFKKLGLDKI